jgi:metal-responsive CopG/Arc/MetJ family transcriptional regulator
MSEKNNSEKFTISMEKELRDWIDAKVKEMNRRDRRFKTSRSALIADAVQNMRDAEEQGKAVTPEIAGANVLKASESSVSGRSTATKKTFRRAG